MPNTIEYCLGNANGVEHPRAKGRLCLQYCGLCNESPFLLVNGEVKIGDSHGDLLNAEGRDR